VKSPFLHLLPVLVFCAAFPARGAAKEDVVPGGQKGKVTVDLGAGGDEAHLGYGWSTPERRDGRTFRWMGRLEADLRFDLERAGAAEIRFRARPLYLGYRRQVLALYVNRRFVRDWVFPDAPEFVAFHTRVPDGDLKAGRNLLTFRAAYRKREGPDTREIAVAVDGVKVEVGRKK
jgi:hypothetical protein